MVQLATKTLDAIEQAIYTDQGNEFRRLQGLVLPHIGDAYRADEAPFRGHLGASGLGRECGREVWNSWRWVTRKNFGGQLLRLFNRGHLEEGRFIAMLLMIGVQVYQQDAEGKQYKISFAGGHGGGSGDGVGLGIPDLSPTTPALLEFKSINLKGHTELVKDGVQKAKFEHYVQTNMYMGKMGLPCTLYMSVCKNNDELYAEIIHFDRSTYDQFLDRGTRIAFYPVPPDRISNSPGWWKCKFCDHRPACHMGEAPDRNCRTCAYSVPRPEGDWVCSNGKSEHDVLSFDRQLLACDHWEKLKGL